MRLGRLLRWLGYLLLGLVTYVIFLLVFAPASYVARGIDYASRGAITLQQPGGSLWHGSGTISSARGALPFDRVQWSLHPWKIFSGSLGAELQFTGSEAEAKFTVDLGLQHHTLHDVSGVLPISSVTRLYPLAELMGLSGRVRLTAPSIDIKKDAVNGNAELSWESAASGMLPAAPPGDYNVHIAMQGRRAAVNVNTVRGTLQITAKGEWRLLDDGVLKLSGTLGTSSPQPALEPFLNSIGRAQSDGRHPFSYENRIGYFLPATLFPF